jgi:hypothetical protein
MVNGQIHPDIQIHGWKGYLDEKSKRFPHGLLKNNLLGCSKVKYAIHRALKLAINEIKARCKEKGNCCRGFSLKVSCSNTSIFHLDAGRGATKSAQECGGRWCNYSKYISCNCKK